MQVTNVKDHVTHAVIGANEAHAFGISDSAAFFRVLSASLYSNKPLAVVREILCNAWDAHIEGNVDRPVEVTIDRTNLIIRDFGSGLSHEQILRNYTTYGGTTKIDNEEVTGGFGLGSKAPFAYVDHFEVTSWHAGTKTIWNLSLSSALVDGKPQVMKIVDIPCGDETGIQVSLKLKTSYDYDVFHKLLRLIARFGEMNLTLNGTKIEALPFSTAKHGFLIVNKAEMPMQSDAKIWIRYGHVVYPLEHHDDFKSQYSRAREFLSEINGRGRYYGNETTWVLILQAAPNMVSITPSRESLSMTDFTIANCTALLEEFNSVIKNGMDEECREIVEKAIQMVWKGRTSAKPQSHQELLVRNQRTNPGDLLRHNGVLPNKLYFDNLEAPEVIQTMMEAATNYLKHHNYPKSDRFIELDMDMRLEALVKTRTLDPEWVKSFRAALKKRRRKNTHSPGRGYNQYDPWLYRKVIGPLIQIIDAQKFMKASNLLFYTDDKWGGEIKPRVLKEMMSKRRSLAEQLPWMRKIMILSHNRVDIADRAHNFPVLKDYLGSPKDSFAYIVPRHQGRIEEARELFTKLGFKLIDLTTRQKWEPEIVKQKLEKKDAPPRRKGLSKLSNLLIQEGTKLSISHGFDITAPTLEKPEMVMVISPTRQDVPNIAPFNCRSRDVLLAVIRIFGERVGMAANTVQMQRYIDAGAKRMSDDLYEDILKEYQTNPKIEEHYRNYRADRTDLSYECEQILALIRMDDILRGKHGLPAPLKRKEMDHILIFESLYDWEKDRNKHTKAIKALTVKWTASPALTKVQSSLKDNHLVSLVDPGKIKRSVLSGDAKKASEARDLLDLVMKG